MPRETVTKPTALERRRPMTLAELLDDDDDAGEREGVPEVAGLPPLAADAPIRRSPRTLPVLDLAHLARAWLLIGEGNLGKTLVARWMADQLLLRGQAERSILATVAPGNRSLASYVETVLQPETADPRATAEWTRKVLSAMARRRMNGVIDGGGGDASMGHLIRSMPGLTDELEERLLAMIATYFLGPRVDDAAFLASYEKAGFRPRATALVLNLGRAETPAAFDDIRRLPAYKAALDRGAVELWLPALPQEVALAIERKRLHFTEARDGIAPEERAIEPLKMLQRSEVARWLGAMEREFAAVQSWLPWE